MRLVKQPKNSEMCGQCCVAMAARIPKSVAIETVGHSHATRTREIVRALQCWGIKSDVRLRRFSRKRANPKRAIVNVEGRHWALWWDGRVYDPARDWGKKNYKFTSYLEIYE